jgi:hypothetical protein
MAEIKSTLDIIMERTKNLTMTDKEKASFRRTEAEGKVKGWIQKYQDGVIELDTLKSDFEKDMTEYPEVRQIFKSQLLGCLRLTGDNGKIFRLLEDIIGINTNTIKNTIQSLKQDVETLRIERTASIREDLRGKKIYGSSVVPNPDRGGYLQDSILKAESELRRQLQSLEG